MMYKKLCVVLNFIAISATFSLLKTKTDMSNNITGGSFKANEENFKILLNLYKLNPLRKSKIFAAYSNKLVLPYLDEDDVSTNSEVTKVDLKKDEESGIKFNDIVKIDGENPVNYTKYVPDLYLDDVKDNNFEITNELSKSVWNRTEKQDNVKNTKERKFYKFLTDNMENEDVSDVSENRPYVNLKLLDVKPTRTVSATTDLISIPEGKVIVNKSTATPIEEKVENDFAFEEPDNDIVVLIS